VEPFADVQDVQAIWRPLSDDESVLVAAWIIEASQQVRDEVPDVGGLDVDERVALAADAAHYLSAATVRSVVARMVRRVLMNPEGARQRSQSVDDYSESVTVDSSLSSGEMFISPREMARLLGSRGGSGGGAFSVDTAPASAMWSGPLWGCSWDQVPS
jgi:hypothetical protein